MNGSVLVREARRRSALTQAELAARLGTTQSSIARLEAGVTAPSLARVAEAAEACGLVLDVGLTTIDPAEWEQARRNLSLSPDRRVRNMLAAIRLIHAGRASRAAKARRVAG